MGGMTEGFGYGEFAAVTQVNCALCYGDNAVFGDGFGFAEDFTYEAQYGL